MLYEVITDKAARFVEICNQKRIPLLFLQDVTGFMVGSHAERGGVITSYSIHYTKLYDSRLTQRVRSDEGLAYGAGSGFGFGAFWPTTFTAGYASKNPTVALALQIVLDEIARIRREPVSASELEVSKRSRNNFV